MKPLFIDLLIFASLGGPWLVAKILGLFENPIIKKARMFLFCISVSILFLYLIICFYEGIKNVWSGYSSFTAITIYSVSYCIGCLVSEYEREKPEEDAKQKYLREYREKRKYNA